MKKIIKHLKKNWLRYGLETIVVVNGVLIAFALSSWNENRQQKHLELNYLQELKRDFEFNKVHHEFTIKTEEILRSKAQLLIEVLTKDSIVTGKELVLAVELTGYNPSIAPQSATWDDLVSTGNTSIFQNSNLIKKIADYYNQIAIFRASEREFDHYKLWYRKEILGVLTPEDRLEANAVFATWVISQTIPEGNRLPSVSDYQEISVRLKDKSNLAGIVTDIFMFRRVNIYMLQTPLNNILSILDEIDKEIENLK